MDCDGDESIDKPDKQFDIACQTEKTCKDKSNDTAKQETENNSDIRNVSLIQNISMDNISKNDNPLQFIYDIVTQTFDPLSEGTTDVDINYNSGTNNNAQHSNTDFSGDGAAMHVDAEVNNEATKRSKNENLADPVGRGDGAAMHVDAEMTNETTKRSKNKTLADPVDRGEFTGLLNLGNTCYMNTLIQTLFMTPELRNEIWCWDEKLLNNKDFAYQLRNVLILLGKRKPPSVSTRNLMKTLPQCMRSRQQDVIEAWHLMLQTLETTLQGTEEWERIKDCVEGEFSDYVQCLSCNTLKKKTTIYREISLSLKSEQETYSDIMQCLYAFIEPELLTESNKYFCDTCNQKCDARKGLTVHKLPYILFLHLKRFDYISQRRKKLDNRITFPDYLDLDEFMEDCETVASGQPLKKNMEHSEAEKVTQPEKAKKYMYELYIIIMHSGQAHGGHYCNFIKSLETTDWYLFNDTCVFKMNQEAWKIAFDGLTDKNPYGVAYILGYRQIDKSKNVMSVESSVMPETVIIPQDVEIEKRPQRYVSYDTGDVPHVKVVVYRLSATKEFALSTPHSRIQFYCHSNTTLQEVKVMAYTKFKFDDESNPPQFCRLVKYNAEMRVPEYPIEDEDMMISSIEKPIFYLEPCSNENDAIDPILFTHVQFKIYILDMETEEISCEKVVKMPKHFNTQQMINQIIEENNMSSTMCLIHDVRTGFPQLITPGSENALDYIEQDCRFYVVENIHVSDDDVLFNKTRVSKLIRKLRRCFLLTIRYSEPESRGISEQGYVDLFYTWETSKEKENHRHIGITVPLTSTTKMIYTAVGSILNIDDQFVDIFVEDASGYWQKLQYGLESMKDVLSSAVSAYQPACELVAKIRSDILVAVVFMDLSEDFNVKHQISFEMKLPCTIGQCKKKAISIYSSKYNLDLKHDRCRLRKYTLYGVTRVYADSQSVDGYMRSFDKHSYEFCLQHVPQGDKLFTCMPGAVFMYAIRYCLQSNTFTQVWDLYLADGTQEEFVEKLSNKSGIPIQHLDLKVTAMHFPFDVENPDLYVEFNSYPWIPAQPIIPDWEMNTVRDGKVVFYRDMREVVVTDESAHDAKSH